MRELYLRLGLAVLAALTFAPVSVDRAVAAEHQNVPVIMVQGEVTVVHIDYFEQGRSKTSYYLRDLASNTVFQLQFERQPPATLKTGDKVTVRGRAVGRKLWVGEIASGVQQDGGAAEQTQEAGTVAAAAGERRALLMVINMTTAPGYYGETTAQEGAGALFTDGYSVDSVYRQSSFGQLAFPGDRPTDVIILDGIPYNAGCPFYTIARDADAAAVAAGIDLAPYQHKVYLVPPASISDCNWIALGELGSFGSTSPRRSWSTRNKAVVHAHEIGHNLAWHHAATDPDNDGTANSEYGDISDVMGYCCYTRKFNAPHMDQIGWFDGMPGTVVDVTAGGDYTIAVLGSDPNLSSDPQVLRIDRLDSVNDYYLSYRQPIGLDAAISATYTSGVNIHHANPSGIWSYFIDALANGESFVDAANGLTITQTAKGADFVTVNISFGGCVRQAPSLALGPSTLLVSDTGGAAPIYNATLTNNDSQGCDDGYYGLSPDSGLLSSTVTPNGGTVAPGQELQGTLTVDVAGAADGVYTLWLTATDSDVSASANLRIDTTAPLAPSDVGTAKKKVNGVLSVRISWSAAADVEPGSGVVSYRVWRDGAAVGVTSNLNYTDGAAPVDGTYVYTVTAIDRAGYESPPSADAAYPPAGGGKGKGKGKGKGGGKPPK
ncbi:MAG: hypothetical protein IID53_16845 [Proteobacteria bacterium]|nr:hypothetical protein [Pseudomonadota bacterium]